MVNKGFVIGVGENISPTPCTQITFEGRGLFETNVRIQWKLVHKAFHRICCCGNKTNCQISFERDLDAANLRPALGHGCGMQLLGASILVFRANLL